MFIIIGSDGQQYGPVSLTDLQQWAQQGRLQPTTQVQLKGATDWRAAETFPELAGLFSQYAKPATTAKTSGLAITSLVLGLLGFCTLGITGLAGIIVGAIALSKIGKSQGQLSGKGLAIGGLCSSGASVIVGGLCTVFLLLPALGKAQMAGLQINCMNNMRQMTLGVVMFADDHDDALPKAENWCDAIKTYCGDPKVFVCPSKSQDGQRCHYSFNAKLKGKMNELKDPSNTVIIFESAGGWNANGGNEDVVGVHQSRHNKDVIYLFGFADGSVRAVSKTELSKLRWNP